MDMSKVSRSMWIVVGGTVVTLIGTLLLDWYSVTVGFGQFHVSASIGAWDTGTIGKLAVLGSLVMLAGAVLLFVPNPPELPIPLPMAMLVVSAFTALMVVLKRSMNTGFAGIENELFYDPKTTMLFGDAKESVLKLITAVKAA